MAGKLNGGLTNSDLQIIQADDGMLRFLMPNW